MTNLIQRLFGKSEKERRLVELDASWRKERAEIDKNISSLSVEDKETYKGKNSYGDAVTIWPLETNPQGASYSWSIWEQSSTISFFATPLPVFGEDKKAYVLFEEFRGPKVYKNSRGALAIVYDEKQAKEICVAKTREKRADSVRGILSQAEQSSLGVRYCELKKQITGEKQ